MIQNSRHTNRELALMHEVRLRLFKAQELPDRFGARRTSARFARSGPDQRGERRPSHEPTYRR